MSVQGGLDKFADFLDQQAGANASPESRERLEKMRRKVGLEKQNGPTRVSAGLMTS